MPRHLVASDSDTVQALHENALWFGPNRLIVQLLMPDHRDVVNLTLVSENDEGTEGGWFAKGDLETIKERFSDFAPLITKLLDMANPDETYVWRLSELPELETWSSKNGRVVLMGDAAHAMLPYAEAVSLVSKSRCP